MTVKGCEEQGGKWQKGCAVAEDPLLRQDIPKVLMGMSGKRRGDLQPP